MKYPYKLVTGHIIVESEQKSYLIDTGAPTSVSSNGDINFAGLEYPAQSNYMGVTADSLTNYINTKIHGLVGADIINQFDIIIDPEKSTLLVTQDSLDLPDISTALDFCIRIPIVEVSVNDRPLRMFFDTGAQLSYLPPDIVSSYPSLGKAEDFYPGLGNFTTSTYEVPCKFSTEQFVLRVGILPTSLQAPLMMANTSGILGTMILEKYRIFYAPRRSQIALQKIKSS